MKLLVLLTFGAAHLVAQALSIHPFFEDGDLVDDPRIENILRNEESFASAVRKGVGHYELADPDEHELTIKVFRLGGSLFADLHAKSGSLIALPLHLIVRISFDGDDWKAMLIDEKTLGKLIEGRAVSLESIETDDMRILTASTKRLRSFLLAHAQDPAIFNENGGFGLLRHPPPPPPPAPQSR